MSLSAATAAMAASPRTMPIARRGVPTASRGPASRSGRAAGSTPRRPHRRDGAGRAYPADFDALWRWLDANGVDVSKTRAELVDASVGGRGWGCGGEGSPPATPRSSCPSRG